MSRILLIVASLWLASILCLACASCQRGRPVRKELPPGLSMLPEIGSTVTPYPSRWSSVTANPSRWSDASISSNYLFYSTDTSILVDGLRHDFLVLAIPDPSRDSVIGSLIESGQSLAPFLLTQLHQLNKAGVVIDLRVSINSPAIRQDYAINSPTLKETNMPVIFLWDNQSAGRAAFYTQFLQQFPGVTCTITRDRPHERSDCFTDIHPTF